MSWSLRRQIIIFCLVTGFFALTAFILWFVYHPRPNCFDGIKNQTELDVDCGGECFKVCAVEVSTPIIRWQRAFVLGGNNYGIAALIENKNDKFGIEKLDYVFRVFNDGQILLATIPGSTFVNPNERVVIYQPNVLLGEDMPTRILLDFGTTTWRRQNKPVSIELAVSEERFINSSPNPQARAVIRNTSLETYRDIDVQVVLSDTDRNVFAVSQTFISVLEPNQAQNVFFSWPETFDLASSSETIIDIYPRFNTLKQQPF